MLLELGQASWEGRQRAEASGAPAFTPEQLGLGAPPLPPVQPTSQPTTQPTGVSCVRPSVAYIVATEGIATVTSPSRADEGGEAPPRWAPTAIEDIK